MAIEIVDFPINSMVIFHSYLKLPEGIPLRILQDTMAQRSGGPGVWKNAPPHVDHVGLQIGWIWIRWRWTWAARIQDRRWVFQPQIKEDLRLADVFPKVVGPFLQEEALKKNNTPAVFYWFWLESQWVDDVDANLYFFLMYFVCWIWLDMVGYVEGYVEGYVDCKNS